jgi:hypothetical protein
MKKQSAIFAVVVVAALWGGPVLAAWCPGGCGGPNNFSAIGANIIESISNLPGLISGLAYLFGLLLGATAIVKIKDHVENPHETPLKDGLSRFAAGGALFALPAIYEAMTSTVGAEGAGVASASLAAVSFAVGG